MVNDYEAWGDSLRLIYKLLNEGNVLGAYGLMEQLTDEVGSFLDNSRRP